MLVGCVAMLLFLPRILAVVCALVLMVAGWGSLAPTAYAQDNAVD